MSTASLCSAWWFGLVCLGACRNVIGIEDAEVAPTLGESGSESAPLGDSGAPAGTAGNATIEAPGGSSSGGNGAGVLSETTCERYCNTLTQTCTAEFAQYPTHDGCLAVCQQLPEGVPGDTSGNSLFCRLQAAGQAPLEPSYYCPIAGPGGNGVCGSNCEGLCSLLAGLCGEELADESPSDCEKSCNELSDMNTYSVAPEAELSEGKHVQCRLYHVSVAAEADPEQHCQHALGSSPCGS